MKCLGCNNKKNLKKELKNIKFTESGLDYVTLVGIATYHCDECGEDYQEIPKMEELMALIVKTILHKKDLIDAKELVFVRKYLGFSRKQLSNLLKYSYEHLAKVEKENTGYKVSRQLDGSLRAMLLMKLQCPEYEYLDKIETDKLQKLNRLFIHPTKSGWEVDEAA